MLGRRNPKSHKGKRVVTNAEPKLVENEKTALFLQGPASSQILKETMLDMRKSKVTAVKTFHKKNQVRPFEDVSSMEFFSRNNDCSLFAFGSHSKKRKHNMVLGRMFDHQLLDMVELGIDGESFISMKDFGSFRKAVVRTSGKPMFAFNGDAFETEEEFVLLKSLVLDFFKGEEIKQMNLAGLDRIIVCSAVNGKLYFRQYGLRFTQSETKHPGVELDEIGPHLDLTVRRMRRAGEAMQKAAMTFPRDPRKKQKNVENNAMGDRVGRVHMHKQNLNNIANTSLKRFSKLSAPESSSSSSSAAAAEEQ
jgi:ribosome production factor 2